MKLFAWPNAVKFFLAARNVAWVWRSQGCEYTSPSDFSGLDPFDVRVDLINDAGQILIEYPK